MPNVIISDTSCLIILTKIEELDLLRQLYNKVTITQEIFIEFGEQIPDWIEV
jgi:predicted nucleic acid-binding protein